jgi:hypothetical protein
MMYDNTFENVVHRDKNGRPHRDVGLTEQSFGPTSKNTGLKYEEFHFERLI